jgi:Domain of unknown function (DUF5605)
MAEQAGGIKLGEVVGFVPQELVRRCWEGAVRGGCVAHGETYFNDHEEIWWSKGGDLVGTSPERIALLDRIVGEAPGGAVEPLPTGFDVPIGGVADEFILVYLGNGQSKFRSIALPEGSWNVDVIDTWAMTIEPFASGLSGSVRSTCLDARTRPSTRAVTHRPKQSSTTTNI